MDVFKPDQHSIIHFVGCYAITLSVHHYFSVGILISCLIGFACGVLWECLDELNNRFDWNISLLDRRGADALDLVFDFAGAMIPYIFYLISMIHGVC